MSADKATEQTDELNEAVVADVIDNEEDRPQPQQSSEFDKIKNVAGSTLTKIDVAVKKFLRECPLIKKIEDFTGIDREKLFYVFCCFIVAYLMFGPGNNLLFFYIGSAYPAYATVAVQQKSAELKHWTVFWPTYVLFEAVLYVPSMFLSWLPLYMLVKTIIVLYMMLPQTYGAEKLFDRFILPLLTVIQDLGK